MNREDIKHNIKNILRNNPGTHDSNVEDVVDYVEDLLKDQIQKMCKWLEDYGWKFHNGDYKDTIEDFRKAMED